MNSAISVVINTLNEEENLPYAIQSVLPWADDIVVVDMHSTDRTVDVARRFGARVCLNEGPGFSYPPRHFAVAQALCDWVFVLDADELAPPALSQALRRLAQTSDADVVLLPRRNYLLGSALNHTGWGPTQDHQVRFFRKGKVLASSIAHRDFVPSPEARVLRLRFDGNNAIVHFNYLDIAQFIEKLNRYTSIEAQQALDCGQRSTTAKPLIRAAREFLIRYLLRCGFLDGWRGLYLSLCMSFYRMASAAKLGELEMIGTRRQVAEAYRREAERILESYATERTNEPATSSRSGH